MRSSSVATSTRSIRRARRTRSCTCWIIGLPWMSERGFPGSRLEPKRAGMIATMAKTLSGPSCTVNDTRCADGASILGREAARQRLEPGEARVRWVRRARFCQERQRLAGASLRDRSDAHGLLEPRPRRPGHGRTLGERPEADAAAEAPQERRREPGAEHLPRFLLSDDAMARCGQQRQVDELLLTEGSEAPRAQRGWEQAPHERAALERRASAGDLGERAVERIDHRRECRG